LLVLIEGSPGVHSERTVRRAVASFRGKTPFISWDGWSLGTSEIRHFTETTRACWLKVVSGAYPESQIRNTVWPVSSKRFRQRMLRQATMLSIRTMYDRARANCSRSCSFAPPGI
jgi:hypothetical protein